jgi:hypothetical protein
MNFEKPKICMYWANLLLITLTISCQYQEPYFQKDDAEPFDLKEPEKVESAVDERVLEPTISEDGQVIYQPGEVPWAEPSHRVVFHSLREGHETTRQPKYEQTLNTIIDVEAPIFVDNIVYHKIDLRRFSRSYPSSNKIIQAREIGYVYTGFHWPEELRQSEEPTLHMFACPVDASEQSLFYEVGELIVECSFSKSRFFLHFPPTQRYETWLDCERARYTESYSPGQTTGCESEVERQPTAFVYEVFHWVGLHPKDNQFDLKTHSRIYSRRGVFLIGQKSPLAPSSNNSEPKVLVVDLPLRK